MILLFCSTEKKKQMTEVLHILKKEQTTDKILK